MYISSSNAHSASSAPTVRLTSVRDHMAGSNGSIFTSELVPQAPEDPLFGLMAAYRNDEFENKVDLGIGAYRDNNAKPWVLPVIKKVKSCPAHFYLKWSDSWNLLSLR